MSLLRSQPTDGIPWKHLLIAALFAWAVPSLIGVALLGLFHAGGDQLPGNAPLYLWSGSVMMLLSPMLSFAGLVLAVPLSGLLLRAGWFGWLIAAAIGAGVGALMSGMIEFPAAAPFGVVILLLLRFVLGRLRPLS